MHRFISSSYPSDGVTPDSFWFIFHDDQILLKRTNDSHTIPRYEDYLRFEDGIEETYYLGSHDGRDCYTALMSQIEDKPGYDLVMRRKAYYMLTENEFALAGRAFQTAFFHQRHMFCGACGAPMAIMKDIIARKCDNCGTIFYPQQAPAVIMAVTRGNEILLARSPRFRNSMYSVLAGFVEPGETLEDSVKREVREECGIEIKNIAYFSSQPWPFPNSLMIGFTAEYESGEITIDEDEIIEAGWYTCDALPRVPDRVSIAGRLINRFVEEHKHTTVLPEPWD